MAEKNKEPSKDKPEQVRPISASKDKPERVQPISVNRDEQVGFHKGSIATLLKEREEMVKVVSIVDSLLKAHIDALKKLGVELAPPRQEATKKKG